MKKTKFETSKAYRIISLCIVTGVFPLISNPAYAGVNPDGSYSESLPIEIPAGRNGIQPKLALSYNSNGGNGIVGVGWSLQGLPAITRINYGRGINYDGQDTFSGPEGRLIDVSASAGAPAGTVFHAENEGWSKYEALGWDGNLLNSGNKCGDFACSFRITDRSGLQFLYGDAGNARVIAINSSGSAISAGSIRIWGLSRVIDLHGNHYEVEYFQDAGQFYPRKITYTLGGGASRYFAVTFDYDRTARPDKEVSYAQASYVQTNWRLREINVTYRDSCLILFTCTEPVRKYESTYAISPSTGRSQLTGWKAFAADNSTVTYSTIFEYSSIGGSVPKTFPYGPDFVDADNYKQAQGDFNGDGKEDVCWRRTAWTHWQCSSVTGNFSLPGYIDIQNDHNYTQTVGDFDGDGRTDIAWTRSQWFHWNVSYGNGSQGSLPNGPDFVDTDNYKQAEGDFNGDGRADICWRRTAWTHWQCTSVTGSFLLPGYIDIQNDSNYTQIVGDFDGDGRTDIAWTRSQWFHWNVSYGNGSQGSLPSGPDFVDVDNYKQAQGDFNGDGRTDICWRRTAWIEWNCTSAKGAFTIPGYIDIQNDHNYTQAIGDFDGDGRTDIAWTRSQWFHWNVSYGNGSQGSLPSGPDFVDVDNYKQAQGDFNGDGRTDICWRRTAWIEWNCTSARGAFALPGYIDIQNDNNYTQLVGDFDGDGRTDIAWTRSQWFHWNVSSGFGGQQPDKLLKFTDNTGKTLDIQYVLASNLTGVIDSTNSVYPNNANTHTSYLVTSLKVTSDRDLDNVAGNDSFETTYEYYNGRVATGTITERASLGFEKIKTTDVNSGNYKIDTYHQTKPYHTMLKETRSYLANGTPLSAQITGTPELWLCNESGCTLDPTSNPNPTVPKQLRQSGDMIAKQYINGVEALTERQSIVSADAYGNPLESRKVKQLGSEIYTDHTYATYINHVGDGTHARAIGLPVTTKKCVEDCSLFNTSEDKENLYDNQPSGDMGLRHLITSTKTRIGSSTLIRNLSYYPNGNLHIETNDTAAVKTLSYDPDYEQYVRETRLTIPGKPDQVSLQYVDVRYGVVTESVDLNGTKTQTELDDQGRIIGKRIKNSSDKLLSRSSYEYHLTGNSNPTDHYAVECVHRKDSESDNTFNLKDCKYTYLDAMERKYLTIAPAVNGANPGYAAVHTKYDNKNRVTHVSEPYFKADTSSSIGAPAFYSETIYDTSGRAWQQIAPDGKVTETNVYYTAGSNFVRTEIIGAGTVKESTTDARGLTRSVTEAKGTGIESTITNTYFPNGLLWQVSVPQGLTILDYYADTKKKKSIIDPNAGRTDYTYVTDIRLLSNGNVLAETRPAPNGSGFITVTHEYSDPYGRLTRKVFSSGEEQLLIYDEADVAYGRNQLTSDEFKSQGYSYKRRHSYNELGQELQTTVDIRHTTENLCSEPGAMPCHTRVENVFDELGRKKKIIYPDEKETVISYFGSSPSVSSIAHNGTTYVSYDGYDNRAKPTGLHHGNGTHTEFTYVPQTGMMDGLKTFDVQNRPIQDLIYSFNDRNNIEDLTDNIVTGGSYHYEYDALNRVKQATRTDGKVFNYAFDDKGNLTLKENRTQVYGTGTTKLQYSDLATQTGTIRTNFSWSSAGNLIQRSTNSEAINYTWSGENFLIESTRVGGNFNGTKMRNIYAGESNRFLRIYEQPGKQKVKTWSLGGIEFRETWSGDKRDEIQVTKYIYGIDGARIASITGTPGQLVVSSSSSAQFAMAKFYSGQGVSGIIAKAPHLFMGCYYLVREAYANYRYSILIFMMIFAVLLLCFLTRQHGIEFTFGNYVRRLMAFATLSAFALANCTGGKSDPAFSNSTYSIVYGKIDELYKGLPSGTVYYHGNHLGSNTLISDEHGLEKIRVHYTTYGEVDQNLSGRWDQNTATLVHDADQAKDAYLSVAYTGQSYSAEEEMYFYGARHYDATIGVFVSADSIVPDAGTPMGYNRYMYVRGNPIKYTDPTGHSWWDDFTDWVEQAWEDTKAWVSKNAVAIAATVVAIVVSVITVGIATPAMGAMASTFWGTVAIGAMAGAAGGFAAGATGAWLSGASFGEGLLAGFKGAAIGALSGAAFAAVGYGANKLFDKLFNGTGAEKAAQSADHLDDAAKSVDDGTLSTGDGDELSTGGSGKSGAGSAKREVNSVARGKGKSGETIWDADESVVRDGYEYKVNAKGDICVRSFCGKKPLPWPEAPTKTPVNFLPKEDPCLNQNWLCFGGNGKVYEVDPGSLSRIKPQYKNVPRPPQGAR